jgi:hypothetical protein
MLQHLKTFIKTFFETHADYTSTSNSLFFKLKKKNYHFSNNKLATLQETSGKHIDALQIIPNFLNLGNFFSGNQHSMANTLDELELQNLYTKISTDLQNLPDDIHQLKLDKLIIPKHLLIPILELKTIKTNNTKMLHRSPIWITDLILCALNNTVIRPHFKGTR